MNDSRAGPGVPLRGGRRAGRGTVKAYISLRPGAETDPDSLAVYCKERLAACKYPRQVEILPDLPKTASGKILRRELRSRTHDHKRQQK